MSEFPLRFELDEGLSRTNSMGLKSGFNFSENPHSKNDDRTFETKTDTQGVASIHYIFKQRQPASWMVWLLHAEPLPDQNVHILPLRSLPSGSRISVAIPNP